MKSHVIIENDGQRWVIIARDPLKPKSVIDTNEYMITNSAGAFLLDPGGTEIFPRVLKEVSKLIDLKSIKGYLCSHQDPDIMSSLPLWMAISPEAKVYVSWMWKGFITHFGKQYVDQIEGVEDSGHVVHLGRHELHLVPAHFCHSSGNFNLYDPATKCLFSGDIGSALIPDDYPIFVENFKTHVKFMERFHVRWMPSNDAKNRWIKRVRNLEVDALCPQHGAIFRGADVQLFLDWFEELDVGGADA